jgi:hypothetical protein
MLGSILRYPRLSMLQGCSRYGGNSSAAVLGNRTCFCSIETVRAVVERGRIRSDRTEYPSMGFTFCEIAGYVCRTSVTLVDVAFPT